MNSDNSKLLPPSLYILEGDEFLKSSLNELYSMQIERGAQLFNSTEINFSVEKLDKNIGQLKNNILTYAVNTRKAISTQIADIQVEIDDYEGLIRKVPQSERELLNIKRKLEVNEKLYTFLLEKRATTVIAKASIVSQTKVIERSRSFGIIRPNKQKIASSFVGAGLLIAALIAFLRSFLFHKIESVRELSKATKLNALGGVPLVEKISFQIGNIYF